MTVVRVSVCVRVCVCLACCVGFVFFSLLPLVCLERLMVFLSVFRSAFLLVFALFPLLICRRLARKLRYGGEEREEESDLFLHQESAS